MNEREMTREEAETYARNLETISKHTKKSGEGKNSNLVVKSSKGFFTENGNFVSKWLGEKIKKMFHFKTTSDNDMIYVYENGMYEPNGETTIKQAVNGFLGERFSVHRLKETISYIMTSTYIKRNSPPENLVNLTNGLYNLDTGKLEKHDPSIFSIMQLPFSYEEGAMCPNIKKFISEVVRPEDVAVIQQWFGYCLYPKYTIQKAAMFLGGGANGKSTMLDLFLAFLGKVNVSGIGLQDLERRFTTANLYGKLANIYADLPDFGLKHTGKFKMLTGGDNIGAEQKFKGFFNFTNHAKLIFSANKLPECSDDTDAFYRRWEFVSFPNVFEGGNCDQNILEKLTTDAELSGLFNWAVAGLKKLLADGKFSKSKSTEEIRDQYIRLSSPVAAFVNDCLEFQSDGVMTKEDMYNGYLNYCKEKSLPTLPSNTFALKFKQHFPNVATQRRTINNERKMCWVGVKAVKAVNTFPHIKLLEIYNKDIGQTLDKAASLDTPKEEK